MNLTRIKDVCGDDGLSCEEKTGKVFCIEYGTIWSWEMDTYKRGWKKVGSFWYMNAVKKKKGEWVNCVKMTV